MSCCNIMKMSFVVATSVDCGVLWSLVDELLFFCWVEILKNLHFNLFGAIVGGGKL